MTTPTSTTPRSRADAHLVGREVRLAGRPVGEPHLDDFEIAAVPVPEPRDGQVLIRNTWMSVDPYMRGRMDDRPSYIPPFQLGAALDGGAVGEVVDSRAADIPVGATVVHFAGWRDYAVLEAAEATVVDTALAPSQAYLGVLGTPGLSAYVALTEIAPVKDGDVVFVSAAAGAVGSVAGQLARRLGASRVVGSAGGPDKIKRLTTDFGFDAAIDYRAGSVAAALAEAAPDGIDVYVDGVGGDHLEAAIDAMNVNGRIALVGAVSGYNATEVAPGPNLYRAISKQLSLRGFVIGHHLHRFPAYHAFVAEWLADGTLHTEETVVDGLERAPEALLGVLGGANVGKMLVRLTSG